MVRLIDASRLNANVSFIITSIKEKEKENHQRLGHREGYMETMGSK